MADPFARLESLVRDAALPSDRIRFFETTDGSIVQEIKCGVLFVMAFWSVPSRKAYRKLTEVLASLDPGGNLDFVVVDFDGCPEVQRRNEFIGQISGAGEAAWINQGTIISTSGYGYNPESFEPNTAMLLSMCSAHTTILET